MSIESQLHFVSGGAIGEDWHENEQPIATEPNPIDEKILDAVKEVSRKVHKINEWEDMPRSMLIAGIALLISDVSDGYKGDFTKINTMRERDMFFGPGSNAELRRGLVKAVRERIVDQGVTNTRAALAMSSVFTKTLEELRSPSYKPKFSLNEGVSLGRTGSQTYTRTSGGQSKIRDIGRSGGRIF